MAVGPVNAARERGYYITSRDADKEKETMSCIFCKIIGGEIPSDKVFEDETILAFRDVSPVAPAHILFVPKRHIASIAEITPADAGLAGHILVKIAETARSEGLDGGFRVVCNCGKDACQTVGHLHFHLIGGRGLTPKIG